MTAPRVRFHPAYTPPEPRAPVSVAIFGGRAQWEMGGSAYRPHTLTSGCWCTWAYDGERQVRHNCCVAIEYGL